MIRDPFSLMDAIGAAFDRYQKPVPHPGGPDETFCNMAVAKVLLALGSQELRNPDGTPLNADQMVSKRASEAKAPGVWREIQMEDAQAIANAGGVVVAGMTSQQLNMKHGHVVVCRPGNAELSSKWSGMCPMVSHVGENSLIGSDASWAFPGKLRPRFFQLIAP